MPGSTESLQVLSDRYQICTSRSVRPARWPEMAGLRPRDLNASGLILVGRGSTPSGHPCSRRRAACRASSAHANAATTRGQRRSRVRRSEPSLTTPMHRWNYCMTTDDAGTAVIAFLSANMPTPGKKPLASHPIRFADRLWNACRNDSYCVHWQFGVYGNRGAKLPCGLVLSPDKWTHCAAPRLAMRRSRPSSKVG